MKVLVGVDGSPNSFAAVQLAGRLLSPNRDELILVYASPGALFEGEPLDAGVLERARSSLSRAIFEEAAARLPSDWKSRAGHHEVPGWANVALLGAIDRLQADMVVVGFRGTSLFERFVLGSVSRAIVYSATVPVLVVKSEIDGSTPTEDPAGAARGNFQTLIAYDGQAVAERIAALAGRISWPAGTVGTVMTVVPPMFVAELPEWLRHMERDPDVAAMADAWQAEHDQSVDAARRALVDFQKTLPDCFASGDPLVAQGRPAEKLLEELHSAPYDVAIVGNRGTGRVERLLLGSTSEQLLSKSPCSVLIVR